MDEGAHRATRRQRLRTWARRAIRWTVDFPLTDRVTFYAGYSLLLPFFLYPLFVTRLLPGLDLPFHMAMADLLAKSGSASSPYAPYYEVNIRSAPYAAHFLVLLLLGKVMPLLAAHKAIMVAYIAGLPLSMAGLLAVCRRSRVPALLAFPLAYNLSLHYGFVSFAFSLPILFLLLRQLVVFTRSQTRRDYYLSLGLTAALGYLLFLCHLQNFLFGLCAALAFALLSPVSLRRRLVAALSLAPSVLGLVYWHLTSKPILGRPSLTRSMVWNFIVQQRRKDLGARPIWDDLIERLRIIPTHAMRAFNDRIEIGACIGLLTILAAYFLLGLFPWQGQNKPPIHRTDRKQQLRLASLVFFLGAIVAYLALPHHLDELELMTFFPRFAVLVLLTSMLLIPAGLIRVRGLVRMLVPLPAVLFGLFYSQQLIIHYGQYKSEVADFLKVVKKAPPGLKAIGLVFNRSSRVMNIESALLGLPSFYPVLKPAKGSMGIPSYCGMRHMPCRKTALGATFTDPWTPGFFLPAAMLPIFDLVFVRSRPPGYDPFLGFHNSVKLLAKEGTWELYQRKAGLLVPDPPPPKP